MNSSVNATTTATRSQLYDFFELTKPRITLVVLITAFTGMWLATGGVPPLPLTTLALLGIALASAASSVLNNYVDREVDKYMSRTRNRALPTGRLRPRQALYFGVLLTLTAFIILSVTVNLLTAFLTLGTVLFYVFIYTIWLKRKSSLCTEIGGVAGALPPLIGWVAVTNEVNWPPLLLFGVMFLWQPPHFWALALLRTEDYRAANLPMLPVTHGEKITRQRMLIYTVALLPATIAIYSMQLAGALYVTAALILGLLYLGMTIHFMYRPGTRTARRLFIFSISYLVMLFTVMYVDCQYGGAV
jgi:protoheme IX farnesyltransferase